MSPVARFGSDEILLINFQVNFIISSFFSRRNRRFLPYKNRERKRWFRRNKKN